MGVGAVFISTLAVHRLPAPATPPKSQQDYLAVSIQPIVSFIVLSSVIIRESFVAQETFDSKKDLLDGLSIPFFNFGRNVSRTVSLSATLTSRTRVYPDWLLGINRTPTLPREPTSESVDRGISPDTPTGNVQVNVIHRNSQIIVNDAETPSPEAKPLPSPVSVEVVEDAHEGRQARTVHFPSPSQ